MRPTEILSVLKAELDDVPSLGRVYSTLLSKFEPGEIATDIFFEDPQLGKVVKFFIVFPEESVEDRHTTGRLGFSLGESDFLVTGFVSVQKWGGPELVLEDAFWSVRERLRRLARLKNSAGQEQEDVNLGRFRLTGMDRIKVGEHLCHTKSLRLTIQQPKLS